MKHREIRYLLNENATTLINKPEIHDIVNDNELCHDIQRIIDDYGINTENYKNLGRYYKKVSDLAEDYFFKYFERNTEKLYPLIRLGNHYFDIQHTMAYLMEMKVADFRTWEGHKIVLKGSMAAMILIVCYNIKRKIGAP